MKASLKLFFGLALFSILNSTFAFNLPDNFLGTWKSYDINRKIILTHPDIILIKPDKTISYTKYREVKSEAIHTSQPITCYYTENGNISNIIPHPLIRNEKNFFYHVNYIELIEGSDPTNCEKYIEKETGYHHVTLNSLSHVTIVIPPEERNGKIQFFERSSS